MKTTMKIFMAVMVMLPVFGCNKDEVKVDDYQDMIVGEWQEYAEEGYEWDFDEKTGTFMPGYWYGRTDFAFIYAIYNKNGYYYTERTDYEYDEDNYEHSGTYYIVKDKIYYHNDDDFYTQNGEYVHDFTYTLGFDGKDVMHISEPYSDIDTNHLERIRNEYGDDTYNYVKGEVEKLNFRVIYHRIK